MSVSVCVCLSVRDHYPRNYTRPSFTKFCVNFTYGRGSVFL